MYFDDIGHLVLNLLLEDSRIAAVGTGQSLFVRFVVDNMWFLMLLANKVSQHRRSSMIIQPFRHQVNVLMRSHYMSCFGHC